ncbi:MAG: cyclodeaminase/cyclohydrolase family protein [Clostridia bacterium]|nr:cyclodeaminase/cyclohydrolase family protein [Clostridia bacterium]
MERLTDMTVTTFTDVLASDAPAPGGGSVAALFGACGAALGVMTTNLTIGRKKYADLWEHAELVNKQGQPLIAALLEAVEADTQAFNRLMDAMHLPKDTDEQKAIRSATMQEATKEAVQTPRRTLELCMDTIEVIESLLGRINPNCASDLGVGAAAVEAAARGAWLNVNINLLSIKDQTYVKETFESTQAIYLDVIDRAQRVFAAVEKECMPACNRIEG